MHQQDNFIGTLSSITDTWTKLSASRNGEAQDMTATSDPQRLTAGLCNWPGVYFSLVWVSLLGKLAVWNDDVNVAKTREMCETAAHTTAL